MKQVGFFVFPGFQLLDLAGPVCAFQYANAAAGADHYRIRVFSALGGMIRNNVGFGIETETLSRQKVDTLIVAGGDLEEMVTRGNVASVRRIQKSARRLASVCTGAFLLAELGALEGTVATTHWRYSNRFQAAYPNIQVDVDKIYTRSGAVWTSAGITAGIDLSLALIEDDLGSEVASKVSRGMVVYHRRTGGQSQFSALSELDADSDRIRATLSYARENLRQTLSVEDLAEIAGLSLRQFNRAFKQATGETPAKAVERLRVEAARIQVEDTTEPVELIAESVGFRDPERMRRAFVRVFGEPPQAMRRRARRAVGMK